MKLSLGTPLLALLQSRYGWSGSKDGSRETAIDTLERLQKVCGVSTIGDLTKLRPLQAETARRQLLQKYKPSTVQQTVKMGRTLWRALARYELVKGSNPWELVERTVGAKSPRWNVCTEEELGRLIVATPRVSWQRAAILMLGWHGMRISELCNMTGENLSVMPDGRVRMDWLAKGGVERSMVVQPAALAACSSWAVSKLSVKMGPRTPLIPRDSSGQKLTRQEVYNWLSSFSVKVIGHKVTPHGLRATDISSTEAREGIEKARKKAGHGDTSMTKRYLRYREVIEGDVRQLPEGA